MTKMSLIILLAALLPFASSAAQIPSEKTARAAAVAGTFPDGTTVNIMTAAPFSSVTSVIYQIKQTDGTVCYGLSGYVNGTITTPTLSCVK